MSVGFSCSRGAGYMAAGIWFGIFYFKVICLSSFPSGISALAVALLFFKLKVFSELACASLHVVSPAAGERKVGNHSSIFPKYC